jgi:hypothetical protein
MRTFPRKKAHRKIQELTLTDTTTKMLLSQLEMLEKAKIRAQNDMHEFVLDNVVESVINAGNEGLPENLQQTSLTLYSGDGKTRFSINQQLNRGFDDRAQQATALINRYIQDHEQVEEDADSIFLIRMLQAMLFGASRKKQFRWTPELKKFMEMEDAELPDPRLIQARDILRDAYYTSRSQWYYSIDKWDESTSQYVKLEQWMGY